MEKCGTVPEKHGKNSGSSGDSGLRGMTVSLDEMPNQGEVKVGPETKCLCCGSRSKSGSGSKLFGL